MCVCHELQESSYPYWPGEEGEEMVCGRLSVRLLKVRGHGDIMERKVGSQGAQVHLHQYTHCQDDTANELAIRGAPSSHGHNLTH